MEQHWTLVTGAMTFSSCLNSSSFCNGDQLQVGVLIVTGTSPVQLQLSCYPCCLGLALPCIPIQEQQSGELNLPPVVASSNIIDTKSLESIRRFAASNCRAVPLGLGYLQCRPNYFSDALAGLGWAVLGEKQLPWHVDLWGQHSPAVLEDQWRFSYASAFCII